MHSDMLHIATTNISMILFFGLVRFPFSNEYLLVIKIPPSVRRRFDVRHRIIKDNQLILTFVSFAWCVIQF